MQLVCRSCFVLEEPRTILGPVGYALWFLWLAIAISSCVTLSSSAEGVIGAGLLNVLLLGAVTIATRFIGRRDTCASCGKNDLVAATSPAGFKILKEHAAEYAQIGAMLLEQQRELSAQELRARIRKTRAAEAGTIPCQKCGKPMLHGETGAYYCSPCGEYIAPPR